MEVIRLITLQWKFVKDSMVSTIFLPEIYHIVVEDRESFNYFEWVDTARIELLSLCWEHVDS